MGHDFRDDLLDASSWFEEWENTPRSLDNPYHDVSAGEVLKLLHYYQERVARQDSVNARLRDSLEKMTQEMAKANDK